MTDSPVTISVDGNIAVVTINSPPVNALSHAVRHGLTEAVQVTEQNEQVQAVVLHCDGRTFIAGADIREFGQPPKAPHLPDVISAFESASKPWVAAIHGTALGGGLEVALGCHYRLATTSAKLGLPEVLLGLIPGAGGTVRLPRLVGAESALDIIIAGKPVSANKAQSLGLLDATTDGSLIDTAKEFANSAINQPLPVRLLDKTMPDINNPSAWQASLKKYRTKFARQHAPLAAIAAIENALIKPASDALAIERELFTELRNGEQSVALRYLFMAERSATRLERLKTVAPSDIKIVGVIGGGTMGVGIAAACLLAGIKVVMIERDTETLTTGLQRTTSILANSLERGLISNAQHDSKLSDFDGSTEYAALANADMVIEAVFEELDVKADVFRALDAVVRTDTILASNTSYLDINRIAQNVSDPSRVIGLHFFSPAHVMKLLEIIVTDSASDQALATGFSLGKKLRKITVPAGVCDGFIGNRIMSAYRRVCDEMLEDGALPADIDQAMTDFGFPMGIFQMQDLAGLDIAWAMRKRQAETREPSKRYVHIADLLCESGRFGRKTGSGWYNYDTGKAVADPETTAIILNESERKGITRKSFDSNTIIDTILETMQAEGRAVITDGIAQSPEAIDVVMVNGYGFPRWRGGPMHMSKIGN